MAAHRARARWAAFLIGLLLVSTPGPSLPQELKPIKLGIPTWNLPMIPFVMASEKGFFRAEGLKVEIVAVNSPLMPPALLSGELDYAAALGNVLWAAMQGLPIKALIVTLSLPTLNLVTRPEIVSGRDLKDKAIAVSARGTLTDHIAREAARHLGLNPDKDITTLGVGDQSQRILALQSGRVAGAVLDPPVDIKAVKMGFKVLIRGSEFMEDPQIGLVASDRKIKERREEVRRMVRATLKGLYYARREKAETVAAIGRVFNVDREAAEQSYEVMIPLLSPDATPARRSLESLLQTFKIYTKEEPKLAPAEVLDLSILKEVLPTLELRER